MTKNYVGIFLDKDFSGNPLPALSSIQCPMSGRTGRCWCAVPLRWSIFRVPKANLAV